MKLQWLFLLLCSVVSDALNILVLLPLSPKSHKNVFDPLVEELASRGHKITYIVPFDTKSIENVTIINLELGNKLTSGSTMGNVFKSEHSAWMLLKNMPARLQKGVSMLYENEKFKTFIQSVKNKTWTYDVILGNAFINEGTLPVIDLIDAPVVYLSPGHFLPWHAYAFHVPYPPSYVAMLVASGTKMSFFQRVVNTVVNAVFTISREYFIIPAIEEETIKYFPDHRPLLEIEEDRVDFHLVNNHPSVDGVHPSMPFLADIAGMHCRPGKPVPQEFATFIEGAGDAGFILFSLGSIVKAKDMPDTLVNAFVKAFSRLPQRIIWKYEEDIANLPSKIKTASWLPQQDILASPGCKLIITHGGLNSLHEAVYHSVPLLGFSHMGSDRERNLARATETEFADTLNWEEATEDYIYDKIINMIGDSKYKKAAEKLSAAFRDRPVPPKELGAYWIEYVARHKGAAHLRSPSKHLNFFQYFLVDVMGFISCVMLIVVVAFVCILKLCCCKRKKNWTSYQKKEN